MGGMASRAVASVGLAAAMGLAAAAGPAALSAQDVAGGDASAERGTLQSAPALRPSTQEPAPIPAPGPEPGADLRVWLVTMAPGQAVWERFGHNAIRVLNTRTGQDIAYNWGIFDFNQVDFIPRFLRGEMLYMMAPFRTSPMVESYAADGREVVFQELNLTPAQKANLRDFVEFNARPANRDYRYDYFLDNCSTRVRDVLDAVLDGALADRYQHQPTGTSWRDHIRRLTEIDPLLYTGMDLLLGTPGDESISVWQEMFLPMTLRDEIRTLRIGTGGAERPLVLSEEVVVEGRFEPEPEEPASWLPWYLLLGLGIGGLLAWAGRAGLGPEPDGRNPWAATVLGVVGGAWTLLSGVAGVILVAVLFTDHVFMRPNHNLFLFTPLSLVLCLLVVRAAVRGRAGALERGFAWAVLAIALAGLAWAVLPGAGQQNAIFLAWGLPVHAGLAWGLGWWRGREALRSLAGPDHREGFPARAASSATVETP